MNELDPGLDPKTGKPLNYNPNADVQVYTEGTHGSRAKPRAISFVRSYGRKNWSRRRTIRNWACSTFVYRRLQLHRNVEQKDFADQAAL